MTRYQEEAIVGWLWLIGLVAVASVVVHFVIKFW